MIKIAKKLFSLEEVKKLVLLARNKSELAKLLGYTLTKQGEYSGSVFRIIKSLIKDYNLDTSHFIDVSIKHKPVKRICPQCNKDFVCPETGKESQATCSRNCSNIYFADKRHSEEISKKISASIIDANRPRGPIQQLPCKRCGKVFLVYRKQRFCSKFCASSYIINDEALKEKRKKAMIARVERGDHPGWKVRSKATPSFPEKVIIDIIEELNVPNIVREHREGRWYMDFADLDRKIDLEIDGSQHDLPQQKASDERKDAYLKEKGYTIYRIRWKYLTKEFRAFLKDEVERIFLK